MVHWAIIRDLLYSRYLVAKRHPSYLKLGNELHDASIIMNWRLSKSKDVFVKIAKRHFDIHPLLDNKEIRGIICCKQHSAWA